MDAEDPLVRTRSQVNPYLHGLDMIFNRFKWDLQFQSFVSRKRLKQVKDSHVGQKAVILCNGPSLMNVEFGLLDSSPAFCFGLNKINLLFEKVDFRPHCIVSVNPFVIEQNTEYFNQTDIELYLDSYAASKKLVKPRKNITFLHSTNHQKFAKDVSISLYQGHTVTVTALQLAFHMGFHRVALVGADHNFAVSGAANKVVTAGDKDESHFDPNYFATGMKWHLPDLFESEVWYGRARQMYAAHDREITNCTTGGNLEVFRRETLQEFLGS
jgi:hypothetical protein